MVQKYSIQQEVHVPGNENTEGNSLYKVVLNWSFTQKSQVLKKRRQVLASGASQAEPGMSGHFKRQAVRSQPALMRLLPLLRVSWYYLHEEGKIYILQWRKLAQLGRIEWLMSSISHSLCPAHHDHGCCWECGKEPLGMK